MDSLKKIKSFALISVFDKRNLDFLCKILKKNNIGIISTGSTSQTIRSLGYICFDVSELTKTDEVLDGRVKTLHPKIFGGILNRRSLPADQETIKEYNIPALDLVVVDLYPFEEVVASKAPHSDIIEKIDIGGISLIRAAAKNYADVMVVSSTHQYSDFLNYV